MRELYKKLHDINHKRIWAGFMAVIILFYAMFANNMLKDVRADDVDVPGQSEDREPTEQATEEYRIFVTASEHGSATLSGEAVDVTGEAVLAATGDACSVIFTPDENYKITQILVNDVDCLSQAAVFGEGIYGFTYDYLQLKESGTDVTSYALEAVYDWDETEQATEEYRIFVTASEHGSATLSGEAVDVTGEAVLAATGEACSVIFTPDENYKITQILVNDVDCLSQAAVFGGGIYGFTYDYLQLKESGTDVTSYSLEAVYDWKETEIGELSIDAVNDIMYLGGSYTCLADAVIYNENARLEWSCVKQDGSVYDGVELEVDSSDTTRANVSLNEGAQDNDVFTIRVKPTDTEEVREKKVTVSIPEVHDTQYGYFDAAGNKLGAVNGWYNQETVLKAAGGEYSSLEIQGQSGFIDGYPISSSVTDGSLKIRLVQIDADDHVVKKSAWFAPSVQIDSEKPVIISVDNPSENAWVSNGHSITVQVQDKGNSHVDYITCQRGNESPQRIEPSYTTGENVYFTFDTLRDNYGNYCSDANQYIITAYDYAGNASEEARTTVHVDMTPPRIKNITFSTAGGEGRLNLAFGHFSKNKVTVEAEIDKDAQLSKVTEVYLTYETVFGAEVVLTAQAVNARATFELDAPAVPMEYRNIRLKAVDEVGQESAVMKYSDLDAALKPEDGADNLLIENAAPIISFQLEHAVGAGKYTDASTGNIWFRFDEGQPAGVPFTVDDGLDGSGIYTYTKTMNGQNILTVQTTSVKKTTSDNGMISINDRSAAGQMIPPVNQFEYQLQVEAADNAGNSSVSGCSVYVDGSSPVIEKVNTTSAGWTSEKRVMITGTVKDEGSGISKVVYSDVNDVTKAANEAGLANGSFSFEVSGDQEKMYYIWGIDHVGNVSEVQTIEVKIDNTNPRIDAVSFDGVESRLSFGNFSNKDVTLHIQVSDGTISSGIREVNVYDGQNRISEAVRTDVQNEQYSCDISDVKHYSNLVVEVVDQVGNSYKAAISEVSNNNGIVSSALMIEQTNPEIELDIADISVPVAEKDWVGRDTGFRIHVSDVVGDALVSGIKNVRATLNGVVVLDETYNSELMKSQDFVIPTTAEGVVASDEGGYTLEVSISDHAGNTSANSKTIYIDRTPPQITSVRLIKNAGGEQGEFDSNNCRKFGNFYNGGARLEISFTDHAPSSSVNPENIRMYDRNEDESVIKEYKPVSVSGNIALFDISCPAALNLSVEVVDDVGHTTETIAISQVSATDSIESDLVMLESNRPSVNHESIEMTSGTQEYENKDSGELWFDQDVTFVMQVSEPSDESAIRSMEANINNNNPVLLYEQENASALFNKQYRLNTNAVGVNDSDGSYQLTYAATDNAGNVYSAGRRIYIDRTNPQITGYRFEVAGQDKGSTTVTPVVLADYGYYFKEDTDIKVSVTDNGPSAGLKELRYRFVSVDNQEITGVIHFGSNEKSGEVTIRVQAGFKGQIFTELIDNVNRTSGEQTCNGIIYETPDLHSRTSSIDFLRSTSEKKDGSGQDLFNASVPLTLHVEDTYSGIAKIEWQVVSDGDAQNNQSGEIDVYNNGTWSDSSWRALAGEQNLRTILEKDIVVSSNSNNIRVSVKLTDRAGNTSYEEDVFSIDTTSPTITVSYSNNDTDAQYEGYFKESRVATVSVMERNFDADDVSFIITNSDEIMPVISDWTVSYGSGNGDDTTYLANITYAADGDYTFDVQYVDEAGNAAYGADYGSSVAPTQFTVDTTLPEVELTYDTDNQSGYYDAPREGTITVREHNFDPSRVEAAIIERDSMGRESSNPPAVGEWQNTGGDIHQAKVLFAGDADYFISIQFHDMAGNEAQAVEEQQFVIDNTDPVINITEVEDRHAYNREIIAPVVQFQDVNIEQTSITLTGAKSGPVELKGQEVLSNVNSTENDTKTFIFDNLEEDDIYTLSATATDKAGRSAEMSYRFSVNRNGSTYEITEETQKNMNNKYTNAPTDVVVHEINVDSLAQDSIVVTLTKDNESRELEQQTDYTLTKEGNDGEWSMYTYTVPARQFEKDGYYMVRLHSQDEATNISQNDLESKKAEITFHVDKTNPNLTFLDLKEGETYPVDSMEATISIKDNTYVKEVEILLNGKTEQTYGEDEIRELEDNNANYKVTIGNSDDTQSVQVIAKDAAGNSTQLEVKDFYVTTNRWIRFLNNKAALYGTIAGVIVVLAGGVAMMFLMKKRRSQG